MMRLYEQEVPENLFKFTGELRMGDGACCVCGFPLENHLGEAPDNSPDFMFCYVVGSTKPNPRTAVRS